MNQSGRVGMRSRAALLALALAAAGMGILLALVMGRAPLAVGGVVALAFLALALWP